MKMKKKKAIALFFLAGCMLPGYWIWLSLRPVEIIAVHHRGNNFSAILVQNPPITDKGKINWWMENKATFKEKYNVPNPAEDGSFSVTVWLFGDGYKEEGKYDRFCFNDMKTKKNCIEKDAVFTVTHSKNRGTVFTVYDGDNYRLARNGDIIKVASD
ncbi:DUF943 family protein [Tatumella sp. JGM118]|uniref:DUF943 family protein n=1 Tax=Tatumella terrea TaxID=419007 RepID=A0ABW1W229_9GAMM|nr:DUF943 family protein [Tatumella sp. JGM118]MBS0910789.1 DUF943 family protein [Tatumella sp. JGM118]